MSDSKRKPQPTSSSQSGSQSTTASSSTDHRVRPWLFYDVAISICSTCFRRIDGKIVFEDDHVFMLKRCPTHGEERVLLADDVDYYRRSREVFLKPSEMPRQFNTPVRWGCPYDCGLCADHEQHSCLTLVELTDHCNLECPICYAASGPSRLGYRTLEQIERMLDAVVANEGEPDVVQLSGGEPTLHPQFFDVVAAAKRRPIRHLMINTNGLRLASEPDFARRLADFGPGLEIYLQFDSLRAAPLVELRGVDLRAVRARALDHLEAANLSTTLVATVKRGTNDDELGAILEHALGRRCVRGVTFQPIQHAGRADDFDPARDRLTLTEVRRKILEQTDVFSADDILPVPCHPDRIAMAYAAKIEDDVVPLTGMIGTDSLVDAARNTIVYEKDEGLRRRLFELLSTAHSPESGAESLKQLLCCLPNLDAPGLGYENVFRLIIMHFIDAHDFDVRSVKKTCVHIVHPDDGRLIPFDTYNLFYRDDLERTRLAPLRKLEELRETTTP